MDSEVSIEKYRRQIEAALEYAGGTHTFEDVAEAVADGRMQFWPGKESVIITEIATYPQRPKVLHFFLAGGSMQEMEAMEPVICEWGRSIGCTHAEFTGRRGWERTFLARHRWKNSGLVVLSREL